VAGESERFGDDDNGVSAWLYNGSRTVRIGLIDSEYSDQNGVGFNFVTKLNESGQVIGVAGPSYDERISAWLYDPTLNQTVALDIGDGSDELRLEPLYLGEDGLVLGTYEQLSAGPGLVAAAFEFDGLRPFYFLLGSAAQDLGDLIGSDFDAHTWSEITFSRIGLANQVTVYAIDHAQEQFIYSATIAVPEPASVVTLLVGGMLAMVSLVARAIRSLDGRNWFFANLFLDAGDDATRKDKFTDLSDNELAEDLDFNSELRPRRVRSDDEHARLRAFAAK
jgi:hypothetical protein